MNILNYVKTSLGITGEYQNDILNNYINDVKAFMIDAGVEKKIVNSPDAFGAIARGVADLWNYGSGDGKLSEWFYQRVNQLRYKHYEKSKGYSEPENIKDFLYSLNVDKLDYNVAKEFFKTYKPLNVGMCSAYRIDNKFYRCYDWLYNNSAEFIVRTRNDGARYATMGIAGGLEKLTNDYVAEHDDDELYNIIPFMLVDGINEHGLVCNVNVAPIDHGKTTHSIATKGTSIELCGLMLVRFILDHFASAKDACEYVRDYVSVYNPESLQYTLHYMVADADSTWLIEFYGNECVIKDISDAPYMTNFFLSDVVFNADGTVNTPYTDEMPIANNITTHGAGLERYNMIVENEEDGWGLLTALRYTNAYKYSTWFSEFVGIDNLTVNSELEDFMPVYLKAHERYNKRLRDGHTWHTVHACVYDIETMQLMSEHQEDGEKIINNFN